MIYGYHNQSCIKQQLKQAVIQKHLKYLNNQFAMITGLEKQYSNIKLLYSHLLQMCDLQIDIIIKQSQLAKMITSIQALMKPRKVQKTRELMTLASMIPCDPGDKFVKQKVLQRLLNIESYETQRPCEHHKMYTILQSKIEKGLLSLEGKTDIVEQFIIRAILQKQNWGDLIVQNQWNKIFYQNRDKWSYYEQWIVALCFKGFEKQHGKFLSSNLTKRSLKIIRLHQIPYLSNKGWDQKFKKWMSKGISQLELIHYQIERNLLLSIKLGEDFQQTAQRLNLESILKSTANPMEYDSGDWIYFLCSQFADNKPVKKPEFDGRTEMFSWRNVQSHLEKDRLIQYQSKLGLILNKYTNFFNSFTNEIEASLLLDISLQNNWRVAKENIQKLFRPNNKVKFTETDKQLQQFFNQEFFQNTEKQIDENNKNVNSVKLFLNKCESISKKQHPSSEEKFISCQNSKQNIMSLTVLTIKRPNSKICELLALSQIIPCWPENSLIKQRVLERILNIDYSRRKSFKKYNQVLLQLKANINNDLITLQGKTDPIEVMFISAILKKQTWEDLIIKNNWDRHFHSIEEEWSAYEQWIVFLCFYKFENDEARFLTSCLIRRSNRGIYYQWYCQRSGIRGRNTNYFTKRLQKWLSKDVSQLEKIHYEIERNLLISIKLEQNFNKTSKRMNLQSILSSETNPMENNRKDWISYLCQKINDNYLIQTPEWNEEAQTIQWLEYKGDFKSKQDNYYLKLQCIIYEYSKFFESFTNQIEASLLQDISLNSSWKQAKQHIENLYKPNQLYPSQIQLSVIFECNKDKQNYSSNTLSNNIFGKDSSQIHDANFKKEDHLLQNGKTSATPQSSRESIIWSIPILMQERSLEKIYELITLACMIPNEPKDTLVRQKVLQRLLNLDRFDHFCSSHKKRIKQKQIDRELSTLQERHDPIEQLFIDAIRKKQSWGDLIIQYKWNKMFYRIQDKWSQYEMWILFICFQRYDDRKSTFLSSSILKRGNQAIHIQIDICDTFFLRNKFKKWMSKDISQLKLIHYQIERNLLLSIKLGEDFQQTAQRLNLESILKSTANPMEYDRGDWIYFLCSQFVDNKPVKRPKFDARTENLSWSDVKSRLKKDRLLHYQSKLRLILNKYVNFFESFTNEIEASLLLDISLKNTWKQAQNHIQLLYKQKGLTAQEQRINVDKQLLNQYQTENSLSMEAGNLSKQSLKNIQNQNKEPVAQFGNSEFKKLIESILVIDLKDANYHQQMDNNFFSTYDILSLNKQAMVNCFAEKFDQLVNKIQSKLSIQDP